MATITIQDERKRRESYTCNCSGKVCGCNRDYGQITQDFMAAFVGGNGLTHHEAIKVDRKWRAMGKAASKPGWRGDRH